MISIISILVVYFEKIASFVMETEDIPTYDAEDLIEHQCQPFETLTPYLIKRH